MRAVKQAHEQARPAGHGTDEANRRGAQPNMDYREWKETLATAGIRDGRLHDARHTAATVLLLLGVPERAVMDVMGWSSSSMVWRYQHVTAPVRMDIAERVGGLLWAATEAGEDDDPDEAADGVLVPA
jgi:integrase